MVVDSCRLPQPRLQDKDSLMAWDGLMDFQGTQSQKGGPEDKAEIKELGGYPP